MWFVSVLLLALVCASGAYAQPLPTQFPPGVIINRGALDAGGSPPPSYTGPGDIVSGALGWWGLRAYDAALATAGANAVLLCTASDALCTTIHVTSTGGLSASNITTSTCGSITTCTAKTLYDQSGNGLDETQTTIANRATFNPTGIGGTLPCLVSNANTIYTVSGFPNTVPPLSIVSGASSDLAGFEGVMSAASQEIQFRGSDVVEFSLGSLLDSTAVTANTMYRIIAYSDVSGNGTILVDGSSTTGSVGTFNSGTSITIMSNANYSSVSLVGNFVELGYWPTQLSSGNASSMDANLHSYWSF
jgi:hypothetical protein